jgi:eukaryotic-like serine/threonine-protein kinase
VTITSGSRLGSYEIFEPLGRGGMGEVYRGHDTRLRRDVAVKLVHPHLLDPTSVERLQREARALATLGHPNVASVYELGEADGTSFIVMELVSGETLADRLMHGPLPREEIVRIARQIAAALEAAHDKGIVHRDLKPANIKVGSDGVVKVLDFGLAKTLQSHATNADLPTATLPTREGTVVGTAPYMSPEQMRGSDIDRRSDVWSFGCVVYEMVTGRRAFNGETSADVIAAVIEGDPDWSAIPSGTPPGVMRLLRRCLRRDASQRLRDMGDARLELEEMGTGGETPIEPSRRRMSIVAIAALVAAAGVLALAVVWARRAPVAEGAPAHFVVSIPQDAPLGGLDFPSIAIAPDGTRVAYVGNRGGRTQLFVRPMDVIDPVPIAGTTDAVSPFFSPDGHWIAFFADGQLKKVAVSGGAPITLCPAPVGLGGTWNRDDVIVFAAATGSGLSRIAATGGTPRPLTTLDVTQGEFSHRWPEWLPDGETVVFTVGTSGSWNDAQVAAISTRTGRRTTLVRGGTSPHFVAPGALLYAQRGRLMSVSFDPGRLTVTGTPSVAIESVLQSSDGAAQFSASSAGHAVFISGGSDANQRRLVSVSRDGASVLPFAAPPGAYVAPRASPDGRKLLVTIESPSPDLWVFDVTLGSTTQITFDSGATSPAVSRDGRRVAFSSTRTGVPNLFVASIDGTGPLERLASSGNAQIPGAWAPDGTLVYVERRPATGRDILLLTTPDHRSRSLVESAGDESAPAFSPDGQSLAYVSNETGRSEVYVRARSDSARARRISTDGGTEPVWDRGGRQLYYRNGARMMSVALSSGDEPGRPEMLFERDFARGTNDSPNYDVMPDGRFVMIERPLQRSGPESLHVLLNWSRNVAAVSAR